MKASTLEYPPEDRHPSSSCKRAAAIEEFDDKLSQNPQFDVGIEVPAFLEEVLGDKPTCRRFGEKRKESPERSQE